MSKAEDISKRAWSLREDGKPAEAIGLWFQNLLEQESKGDWKGAIDTLVDLHISFKNLGHQKSKEVFYDTAHSILGRIKSISEKKNVPLRADLDYYAGSLAIDKGSYQDAENHLETYLQSASLNPEEQADIKAHIGFSMAKMGKKEEGIQMIKESINALENPTEKNEYQGKDVLLIWKTGAKLKLAQVIDNNEEAQKLIQEVIIEAREKGLGARVDQAKKLLKTLS